MDKLIILKRWLKIMGSTLSWAFTTFLFIIFYVAAFHPSNQLLITVNEYKEMRVETLVFGLMWITITLNMIIVWKDSR